MTFDTGADLYGRFMGRYSEPLAASFVEAAGVTAGQRVLDVGCGPGALTSRLVDLVGVDRVAAVDPSAPFADATRSRFPGLDVRNASAEDLPFPDDHFDAALAQLVVHFMSDPVAGLREMGRVTRPGGTVAACVWNLADGKSPLSAFWEAVADLDPTVVGESLLPGARDQHLVELAQEAGLRNPVQSVLTVRVRHETFEDWWEPYTYGVGPAGDHVAGLDEEQREALRSHCAERLGPAPFDIVGDAWCMTATA